MVTDIDLQPMEDYSPMMIIEMVMVDSEIMMVDFDTEMVDSKTEVVDSKTEMADLDNSSHGRWTKVHHYLWGGNPLHIWIMPSGT